MKERIAILLMGLCFFGVTLAWALASPISSAVDDDFHLPSIWCATGSEQGICQEVRSDSALTAVVVPTVLVNRCFAGGDPDHPRSPSCQTRLTDTTQSTQGARGVNGRDVTSESTLTYGPYFYTAMRALVTDDAEASVLRIRVANGALASLLLVVALLVSSPPVRVALGVAWLLALVPLGLETVPSTNPVSWSILGIGVLWAFVLSWLDAERWNSTRAWVALGGAATAALLAGPARRDGWLCVGVTLVACLILTLRSRQASRWRWRVVGITTVAVAASLLSPTLGYVRGLLDGRARYGASLPAGAVDALEHPSALLVEVGALPKSLFSVMGGNVRGEAFSALGLNDVHLPIVVPLTVCTAAILLMLWAWAWHPIRKVVAFAWVTIALVALVLGHKVLIAVQYAIQPRHLLPLLVVATGVALLTPPVRRLSRVQVIIVGSSLWLAATVSLFVMQGRYTVGPEGMFFSPSQWWWSDVPVPSATANVLLGSVLTAGWVLATMYLVQGARPLPSSAPSASAAAPARSEVGERQLQA